MADVALLKPLLISQRNESIEQLEEKYSEHIAKLLNLKKDILLSIQRHFDEQMENLHREEIKHLSHPSVAPYD